MRSSLDKITNYGKKTQKQIKAKRSTKCLKEKPCSSMAHLQNFDKRLSLKTIIAKRCEQDPRHK